MQSYKFIKIQFLHTVYVTSLSFVFGSKAITSIAKVVIDTLTSYETEVFSSITSAKQICHIQDSSDIPCWETIIWNYLPGQDNSRNNIVYDTYLSMQPSFTFSCFVAIRGRIGRRSLADFPELRTISLIQPTKDSIIYFTPCRRSSELNPETKSKYLFA